jgi:HPt (histidine-containing phosphotransfer) domain-containing protein
MSAQPLRVLETPITPGPTNCERPIDLVHLSRQTLGDRDLELDLLTLFERQAGLIMQQMTLMTGPGDQRIRRDLAHTLKGSARAVGARYVADAAEALEEILHGGAGQAETARVMAQLEAAVADARAAARELVSDK